MKILHILYSGLGGHGNVFFSMVAADKKSDFKYEALLFGIEDAREQYLQKATENKIPYYTVKKRPGLDIGSYKKIADVIKQSKPDILFLHNSVYILPAKYAAVFSKKKIKIIIRETQPNHLKTLKEWVSLSFCFLAATKIVFLSTQYKETVKNKLALFFKEDRTAVIPNGIDLNIYKPAKEEKRDYIKFGMQSRLSATKDHETLIYAFSILLKEMQNDTTAQLWIAGDGECKPTLEALVEKLEITQNVVFTGLIDESDLPQFINSLDIYIHATLGETMSTAIMQVMACRLPIIATDVPGVNNMIQHKINGLLVPAKDPVNLASAMQLYRQDKTFSEQMAENAFNFAAANYSNEKMFAAYKLIFEEN